MARHCGYCGLIGHNRRTCERFTDALERRLTKYQRRRDQGTAPAGSDESLRLIRQITQTAATLAKRIGTNPVTGEVAVKPTRRQRKCSYCHSFEHDRRRCESLAKDKRIYQEATRIARATVVRRIQELSVGIGTMYVARIGYYNQESAWQYDARPLIIVGAKFNDYTFNSSYFTFEAVPANKLVDPKRHHHCQYVALGTLESIQRKLADAEEREVEAPPHVALSPSVPLTFSEEWLAGANINWSQIDWFAKGKHRNWALASLDQESSRRYHSNKVLVSAAINLGYIPQEEAMAS